MRDTVKSSTLQFRISPDLKQRIQVLAAGAGLDMSEWILSRLFPKVGDDFAELVNRLEEGQDRKLVYAELNDFLTRLSPREFEQAVASRPTVKGMSEFDQNYLAAMIEVAAHLKGVATPAWVQTIKPLSDPYYGTSLKSLRLHLLVNSPVPFRRRNIFIDSSVGDRV